MFDKTVYIAETYKKAKDSIKSPLRYPGGKFYALKHIMPFINCLPHDEYREVFFGGGSVFFAKNKSKYNILNDLENDIMHLYTVVQNKKMCGQLIEMLENEVATKEKHAEIKEFVPQNDIERAFKTYYLNRTSYSGIINKPSWGYAIGKSSPPENWAGFLKAASDKLQNVEINSTDFTEILSLPQRGNRVLIYLDPPYYHADQKRAYTKSFEIGDHERVASSLKSLPYYFCLSYDDCDEIRELYKWAEIYDVSWLYNTANNNGNKRKSGKELIITNYKVMI